ncbi:FHIPEP family type III secretion protein [Pseudopontixanthobacter vadosimaris]|uniref:FHIPEP family type III secretion protein n=1 Tax=Pseudopontixanthobacter vadosimaris TaxID=2726450 RepID=UPI001F0EFC9F|nr:FHIPEP family type III secretion protein [Pseudopontixanthobacter vadosimaris]
MPPIPPSLMHLPKKSGGPAAAAALWLTFHLRRRAGRAMIAEPEAAPANPDRIVMEDVSDRTLVTLDLGYALVHLVDEARGAPLVSRLTGVRKQLSQSFGYIVPQFRVRDSLDIDPAAYRIVLGGVQMGGATIRAGRILAIDVGEVRPGHLLQGEATTDPSFGCPALWIDEADRDQAIAEGFLTVDAATVIATHLNRILSERPDMLLGTEEVSALLDSVKEGAPGLVEAIHPDPLSNAALTRLLRTLLADGLALSHPIPVLTSLALALQQTQDFESIVDRIRADLGGWIVGQVCSPDARLPVVTLDSQLEASILQGMRDPATNQPLIEPGLATMIGEEMSKICRALGAERTPALVVQPQARRALNALLRQRVSDCLVLSLPELPVTQAIEVIETIGAADEGADLPGLQEGVLAA